MHFDRNSLELPLKIGSVEIRNRVALAPMSGVSDLPFRKLVHRLGAGMVVTEMVASRELVCDARESQMRMMRDVDAVHVVQLAGREGRWMGEAARIAADQGADVVDINMGCPAKKVTGGYSGSALMRDLDHAMTLVEATVAAVSVPVTLKMRLGWDDASRNAPQLARRAEAAGVQLVTVHGRTRCQFYAGRADWRAIAEVREAVSIPLIANGDVATRSDCDAILRQSGADAIMVGRAAQGQPWLPGMLAGRDSAPKSVGELTDLITDHYQAMLSHYGINTGVRHARKHLGWYMSRFAAGAPIEMKARIMTGAEPSDVLAAIGEAFSNFAALSLPATTMQAAA
jgi:tRNA-dihydrouridine synthase B